MPQEFAGKLADPAWRKERAAKAAAARQSVDVLLDQVARRLAEFTDQQADRLLSLADVLEDNYRDEEGRNDE